MRWTYQDSLWCFRKGLASSYMKSICCSLFWSRDKPQAVTRASLDAPLRWSRMGLLVSHAVVAWFQTKFLSCKSDFLREAQPVTRHWQSSLKTEVLEQWLESPLCSDRDQGIWWPQGNELTCLHLSLAPHCCINLLRSLQDLIWHPLKLQTSGLALLCVIR